MTAPRPPRAPRLRGISMRNLRGSLVLMRALRGAEFLLLLAAPALAAPAAQVKPGVAFDPPGAATVSFAVPPGLKVFAEAVGAAVATDEAERPPLTILSAPAPVLVDGILYHTNDFAVVFALPASSATHPPALVVAWQACSSDVCYPPEETTFSPKGIVVASAPPATEATLAGTRRLHGFADAPAFVRFLEGRAQDDGGLLERARSKGGISLLLLAVFVGGLLLNLTPCVLPLIPVNLAILGAGAGRASGRRGVVLGAAFGLGIALCFGALGLISIYTKAAFGLIQSSSIFNAAVAIVFCLLALAMLDVVTLDFSRLGSRFKRRKSPIAPNAPATFGVKLVGAFAAGVGAALLSGACVAPVLVSTLVMASAMTAGGNPAGATLPLVLGLGLGFPWPFFGGGVATLPRPGRWMNVVKYVFAAVFIAMAARYALTAWRILDPGDARVDGEIAWHLSLAEVKDAYRAEPRPVLIYLTAESCTACKKMARTTFRDESVLAALRGFHAVKVDCTDSRDPEIADLMTRLGARGFPFFAIFEKLPAPALP